MSYKDILDKYQVLSLNLAAICAELRQSTKPAEYGMWEVESACLYYEDTQTRFWISTLMQLGLV